MDSRKIQEKKEHKQCILKLEQERINKETFTRDSILYSKNILSEEDYGKARLMYSQSLQGPIERELEECQHQMQQISDKASILDLENQHFRTTQQYEQAVFSAFLDLMGIIKQWEQTYIMRSPIDGILNLVDVWGQGQYIKDGNVSFVIMPINLKTPIGKASLPAIRAGEIEIGQRVIISVNNFPEEDYGNLMGKVSAISSIPTADGVYMIDIAFPNGLKTVFNKNLPPAQQLLGSAKIIMEDRRLCDWFVLPLKNLLKSQKILSEENLN
ncbi:MAG: HlyD family secretion protein [Prevotellaceae bacterium]|nr:HlyD family secretion protein [Prevotellaceae bacterium]